MIIFDEKKYAEKMISQGFLTKKYIVKELTALAKYYYKEKNVELYAIKKKLDEFGERYVSYYVPSDWRSSINEAVSRVRREDYLADKKITITNRELNRIKSLPSLNEQKVMFALLVLDKFYNRKAFEVFDSDLYKISKVNVNSAKKREIISSLIQHNCIDVIMGQKYKNKIKYKNDKSKVEITITNFDDFIYEYLNYIGDGRYGHCGVCGKIIKYYNTRKFCKECAHNKEKQRKR